MLYLQNLTDNELQGGWAFIPNYQKRKLNRADLKASVLLVLEVSAGKSVVADSSSMEKRKKMTVEKIVAI